MSDEDKQALVKSSPPPERHDGLRFWVHSRTRKKRYLVDLEAYSCNGSCQCEHFQFTLNDYLGKQIPPEQVVAENRVRLKEGRPPSSVLMCDHILEAKLQFAKEGTQAVIDDRTQRSHAPAQEAPPPKENPAPQDAFEPRKFAPVPDDENPPDF